MPSPAHQLRVVGGIKVDERVLRQHVQVALHGRRAGSVSCSSLDTRTHELAQQLASSLRLAAMLACCALCWYQVNCCGTDRLFSPPGLFSECIEAAAPQSRCRPAGAGRDGARWRQCCREWDPKIHCPQSAASSAGREQTFATIEIATHLLICRWRGQPRKAQVGQRCAAVQRSSWCDTAGTAQCSTAGKAQRSAAQRSRHSAPAWPCGRTRAGSGPAAGCSPPVGRKGQAIKQR